MPNLRIGRTPWLLPVILLATPMLLPLAGRDKSKPPKTNEPPEPSEIAYIIYRIICQ